MLAQTPGAGQADPVTDPVMASEVQYRREDGKNLISLTITGSATGSA